LNASGCTNTATLNLTVNYTSTEGGSSQTACDTYTWNGSTYTTSGVYTYTSLNASGCTNTATLNLIVNYTSTDGDATQTVCDTYNWNGSTYTTSGVYTYTTINGSGCTNTATLNLTVNYNSINGGSSVTNCDSYTWNGSTYTTSGVYTFTTMNASGCTNTATLGLTINYSTTNDDATISSCDSYLWNGTPYTSSGVYTFTSLNIAGCTNTATLTLTIKQSSTSGSTSTGCDYYTWAANGVTYTQSGVYTTTLTNAVGCDSVHTLTFYIRRSNAGSSNLTACDTYTWANGDGQTYTSSANPTYTYVNQEGCDSIHTLNLTVNYYSTSTIHLTAHVSYTWAVTGSTYTAVGSYIGTYQSNAAGCDSIITLVIDTMYGVRINAKVLLDGPYNSTTGLMNDDLRSLGLLPSTEPYTAMSLPAIAETSGETISPAVLSVTGNNAIVDWVYLELRTGAPSYTKVATRRALVQRDGNIVDVDGISPVVFSSPLPGSYWLSVKHRNHLGVMTRNSVALDLNGATFINYSDSNTTPLYKKVIVPASLMKNIQTKQYGSVGTLWSGDANRNKNVKYNGLSNDKQNVLDALGGDINGILGVTYRKEDVNMDGYIKFNNTNNDRAIILGTVGVSTPNNIFNQHTPD
jgi:hypothetical protein